MRPSTPQDRSVPAYRFLDHPGPIAFAHRGGAAGGLENSLAAFARAVAMGYRYLETDVHATADGVLLAFHDATLDRVTDLVGQVAELPWTVVRRARIGGREPIPQLEDLLGTWPDIRLNIDVKHPSAIAPLVRTLRRTAAYDRVCVASFSERRLASVRRQLGPGVCTALGPRGVAVLRAAATHRLAAGLAARAPRARRSRTGWGRCRWSRRSWSGWPMPAGSGYMSGPSTRLATCAVCSTSAWTGS